MDFKSALIEIVRERSFQYAEEPTFKLTSGAMSNFYFNMKKTTQSPDGMYLVARLVFEKIKELGIRPKALGGLTMGADPIAFAVAFYSYTVGEPMYAFAIRKEPKGHGLKLPIEGDVAPGDPVVIIDDVVTTGGSTIKAINVAREFGLRIEAVIVLLDRCEQKGRENIETLGYPVHSILTVNDFRPFRR